jgi:amino acid transporter
MPERAMTSPDDPRDDLPATDRKANFGQTFRAVAWSFLGIRRSADHAEDVKKLNPIHVVIAAVVGAAVFVVFLVVLVRFAIGFATSH